MLPLGQGKGRAWWVMHRLTSTQAWYFGSLHKPPPFLCGSRYSPILSFRLGRSIIPTLEFKTSGREEEEEEAEGEEEEGTQMAVIGRLMDSLKAWATYEADEREDQEGEAQLREGKTQQQDHYLFPARSCLGLAQALTLLQAEFYLEGE